MLPAPSWFDERTASYRQSLDTLHRQRFDRLRDFVAAFYRIRAESLNAEDKFPKRVLFAMLRTQLTFIHHYLQEFDPEIAHVFDGRTRSNINFEETAACIRPLIDEAIADPNRTTPS